MNLAFAFVESRASDYAAGLAFNAFLSMFPLVLGLIALVGLFAQSDEIRAAVEKVLVVAFPADEQPAIQQTFGHIKKSAGSLAVFSVLALIWSGTNLFASMEFALNQIYLCGARTFLRTRLMALAMLGVLVVAIAAGVGASFAVALVPGSSVLEIVGGWGVMSGLLVAIYRFVPNRRATLLEVLPGALAAGLSIEVLNFAFPIYIGFTHGLTTYGREFGLLFVLGLWTYFLSVLLLMGAVMNRMRMDRHRLEGKDE